MKTSLISIVLFVMLLDGSIANSQDLHFSQFYETPLVRNPSLAGIYPGDYRIQTVFRSQWNSVSSAYQTGSLNAEYKLPVGKGNDFLTTGLQLFYDRAGIAILKTTHILPVINLHKSLSSEKSRYLSMGFTGGWVQTSIDRSKVLTNSNYDGRGDGEQFSFPQYHYFDCSVGMNFTSQFNEDEMDNFFIGLAYNHFTHPNNSFYRNSNFQLSPEWCASAGVKWKVQEDRIFTIQADHYIQGYYKETITGIFYGIQLTSENPKSDYLFSGGVFTRWNDALIPILKIDHSFYSISFSYDVNISPLKLSSQGHGGFELGLSYTGFSKRENSTLNAVLCPKF